MAIFTKKNTDANTDANTGGKTNDLQTLRRRHAAIEKECSARLRPQRIGGPRCND